jgi:hypothetical protein
MTKQIFNIIYNNTFIPFITNLNKYDNTMILYFFTEFIKYFNLSTDTRLVAKGQYNDFVIYHNNSFYCMH